MKIYIINGEQHIINVASSTDYTDYLNFLHHWKFDNVKFVKGLQPADYGYMGARENGCDVIVKDMETAESLAEILSKYDILFTNVNKKLQTFSEDYPVVAMVQDMVDNFDYTSPQTALEDWDDLWHYVSEGNSKAIDKYDERKSSR